MKISLTLPIRSILILAVLALSATTGSAQQITWSGTATSTTWATGGNWIGGTAPINDLTTNTALFNSATYTSQPNAGTTSIGGLEFGAGNTSNNLVISGAAGTLSIGNAGTGGTGILMDAGSGNVTLSGSTIKIGANENWNDNSTSSITVNGAITNIGNTTPLTLTFAGSGSGSITLKGNISNGGSTGTTAIVINTTGTGVTDFQGANSYTGGLTIQNGIAEISGNATNLGAGTVTFGTGSAGATNTLEFNGGGNTYTNAVNLTTGDTTTFTFAAGGQTNYVFSNNFTGGGALVVSSPFTTSGVVLSGVNSYSGGTTINSGAILVFGGTTSIPTTGTVSVASGGTIGVRVGASAPLFNQASLANIFAGDGGTVVLATGSQVGIDTTNATSNLFTYNTAITNVGVGVNKLGTNTLLLNGSNTYTGVTTVTVGTLSITSIQDAGSSTANSLGEASGANAIIDLNGGILQYVGSSAGMSNRGMNLTANSTLDSSGSTPFILTGGVTMSGTGNGLTLTGTGIGSEAGAIGSSATTSALSGLTKSGSGMWTLSNNVFLVNNGKYTVSAGTLDLTSGSALYVNATGQWTVSNIIVKSGSTLAFGVGAGGFTSGNVDTLVTKLVAGGTAAGGFEGGSTIGFDTTGGNFSFGGGSDPLITNNSVGGVVGLTKLGANTLTLTAANTYSGATNINGGTLQLNGSSANSTTSVNSTGNLSGTGTAAAVVLNSGGSITPGIGGTDTTSNLKATGLTWNSGSTLAFNLDGGSLNSTSLTLSGVLAAGTTGSPFTISLTGSGTMTTTGTYDLINFSSSTGFADASAFLLQDSTLFNGSGLTGSLFLQNNQLDFVVTSGVPEPGTWVLMLGGLAVLVSIQIRRCKNNLN